MGFIVGSPAKRNPTDYQAGTPATLSDPSATRGISHGIWPELMRSHGKSRGGIPWRPMIHPRGPGGCRGNSQGIQPSNISAGAPGTVCVPAPSPEGLLNSHIPKPP